MTNPIDTAALRRAWQETTREDQAFARQMADEFVADMASPSIEARHASIMAAVLNGIHQGRREWPALLDRIDTYLKGAS